MWIWFAILFIISILSLLFSFYNYIPFFARYRFINKLIRFIQAKKEHTLSPATPISQSPTTVKTTHDEDNFLHDIHREKDFVHWLQRDGVFLLHLLNSHAGEPLTIKCLEDLIDIYKKNYEDKPKLAEKLLKNQFHFS